MYGLLALLHLGTLLRYPEPFVDEAWLLSRAWGFLQTGNPLGVLDSGVVDQFAGSWVVNQWLVTFLQSLGQRLADVPDLFLLRLESLVAGGLLLGVNFIIVKKFSGGGAAHLCTVLLALSRPFFMSAHLGRYDIYAALLGYAALALVLLDFRHARIAALLVGGLAGLALDVHLNALLFVPVIGVGLWVQNGWRLILKPPAWCFAAGYGLGFVFYAVVHFLPTPETFFTLNRLLFGGAYTPPLLSLNPALWLRSLQETFTLLTVALTFFILVLPLAVVAAWRKRGRAQHIALAVVAALLLGVFFIFPQKSNFYAILIAPACFWLVGGYVTGLAGEAWHRAPVALLSRIWAAVALVCALYFNLAPLARDDWQTYREAQAQINALIRPGQRIAATQVYWLGLYDHPYQSWETLFQRTWLIQDSDLADSFAYFQPDVFISDQPMDNFILSDEYAGAPRLKYPMPHSALMQYLKAHALAVTQIENEIYGPIRVYQLR